jgi:hypothetical protein
MFYAWALLLPLRLKAQYRPGRSDGLEKTGRENWEYLTTGMILGL